MEPVTLIVTALTVGATFVAEKAGGEAVKDAYHSLKNAIKRRFASRPQAEMALAESEKDPDTWEKPLLKEITEAKLDKDNDILETAKRLLELADPEGTSKGKYNIVTYGDVQGQVIGDRNTVTQTFSNDRPKEE
ncbi:MAG TPA: hypothetical protein VF297_20300 [Pyrinomonadaceae bacterium]